MTKKMKSLNSYFLEYLFLATVVLVTVTGFWGIYFDAGANPELHHHAHLATNLAWLFLLLWQLSLIANKQHKDHKKVGVLFLIKDLRNGWPFLLAGLFFILNEQLRSFLAKHSLIQPLTEFVGSMSPSLTFVGSFVLLFALLAATGILKARPPGQV